MVMVSSKIFLTEKHAAFMDYLELHNCKFTLWASFLTAESGESLKGVILVTVSTVGRN